MIYCLVGSSGTGKTTILKKSGMETFVSYTTREQRNNEIDGVDYYFISKDKFLEMKQNNLFVETTEYASNLYGISKNEVEKNKDKNMIVAVDINGYKQFKEIYRADVLGIYVDCHIITSIFRMIKRRDSFKNIFKRICYRITQNESKSKFEIPFIIDNSNDTQNTMEQFSKLTQKNLIILLENIPKSKLFNMEILMTYLESSGFNIVNKIEVEELIRCFKDMKTYEFYSVKQLLKNIDKAKYVLNVNGANSELTSTISRMNNMVEVNFEYDEGLYNAINAIYNSEKI